MIPLVETFAEMLENNEVERWQRAAWQVVCQAHIFQRARPYLVLKLDWNVGPVGRKCAAHGLDVPSEGCQASRKCLAAGSASTLIFHRDPQIDRERSGSERMDLSAHILNC